VLVARKPVVVEVVGRNQVLLGDSLVGEELGIDRHGILVAVAGGSIHQRQEGLAEDSNLLVVVFRSNR